MTSLPDTQEEIKYIFTINDKIVTHSDLDNLGNFNLITGLEIVTR